MVCCLIYVQIENCSKLKLFLFPNKVIYMHSQSVISIDHDVFLLPDSVSYVMQLSAQNSSVSTPTSSKFIYFIYCIIIKHTVVLSTEATSTSQLNRHL